MVQFFLESDRVTEFVTHLMSRKPVYAPHRKGRKSFAFDLCTEAADAVLDYSRVMQSVKKFFLPPREKLLNFNLKENSFIDS